MFPEDEKVMDGGELVTDKAGISNGTREGGGPCTRAEMDSVYV